MQSSGARTRTSISGVKAQRSCRWTTPDRSRHSGSNRAFSHTRRACRAAVTVTASESCSATGESRTRNFPILSRSPLPVGPRWRACRRTDSNRHCTRSERAATTSWATPACRVASGIRTRTEWPLRPLPLPVGLPRRVRGTSRKTAESNCNLSIHPVSNRRSRHREVVFRDRRASGWTRTSSPSFGDSGHVHVQRRSGGENRNRTGHSRIASAARLLGHVSPNRCGCAKGIEPVLRESHSRVRPLHYAHQDHIECSVKDSNLRRPLIGRLHFHCANGTL